MDSVIEEGGGLKSNFKFSVIIKAEFKPLGLPGSAVCWLKERVCVWGIIKRLIQKTTSALNSTSNMAF